MKYSDKNEYNLKIEEQQTFINSKLKEYNSGINKLNFELEDLSFIIVKKSVEISEIYSVLKRKYGEKSINNRVESGDLSILSYDKIFHNI